MSFVKTTVLLGALLSAGALIAQQPDTSLSATPAAPQAQAQTSARRAPNPNKQAQRLAKALGLTREQVAQIRPILADRDRQIQQLRADNSLAPADRRAKARALAQDNKAKIEALLNDSQKQQFEQMLADRRNRGRQANQIPQS